MTKVSINVEDIGIGLILSVSILASVALVQRAKTKKIRDEHRRAIREAFEAGKLTRTEYDMLWDLTTDSNFHMARYYLDQAIKEKY